MTNASHGSSSYQPGNSSGSGSGSGSSSGASHPADNYAQINRFFDWIRSLGMVRGSDRWAAGVCGAIAARTKLDPLIVRGIVIVLAILGGPAIFLYAIAWAFLPDATGRIHAEQLVHGVFEPVMIGILALLLLAFAPFNRGLWWQGPPIAWGMPDWLATTMAVGWFLAVVAAGIWLLIYLLRRTPAPDFLNKPFGSAPTDVPPTDSQTASRASNAYAYTAGADGTVAPEVPPAPAAPAAGTWSGQTVGGPDSGESAARAGAAGVGAADVGAAGCAAGAATAGTGTAGTGAAGTGAAGSGAPQAPRSTWDALQDQNRHWNEQNKQRTEHHKRANSGWHQPRHPGAGFSAITLGLALVVGAAASGLYTVGFEAGVWTGASLLLGIAFVLGILAVGIIVSGIRGRDSGAMGGFAFVAAAALVFLGVFPQGTQFSPFGNPNWTVSSNAAEAVPGYAIIAGQPTVDLSRLDNAPANDGRTIDVWLGFGETELILPSDRAVTVESNLLAGAIEVDSDQGSSRASNERGGVFFHDTRTFNSGSSGAVTHIRVWSFAGQVSILDER